MYKHIYICIVVYKHVYRCLYVDQQGEQHSYARTFELKDWWTAKLQHVPPISDLENRGSSVPVVGRILEGLVRISLETDRDTQILQRRSIFLLCFCGSSDHVQQGATLAGSIPQVHFLKSDKEVAHFGHPFCLDLYYDTNRLDKNEDKMPKWPQLFVSCSCAIGVRVTCPLVFIPYMLS